MMSRTNFQSIPLRERHIIIRSIVDRMLKAYRSNDISELAEQLGLSTRAVNEWENVGRIPMEHIFQCHFDTGVTLDWLIQIAKPAIPMSSNPNIIKELVKLLTKELEYGIRYELITKKSDGGIEILADYLSVNLLAWVNNQIQRSWPLDNLLSPKIEHQTTAEVIRYE